jgi:polysaccharide biosynthesis protein PslH
LDGAEISRFIPEKTVWVIPNGADCPEDDLPPLRTSDRQVLFTGNFRYFTNVDAAHYFYREILPLVCKSAPDVEFLIVGKGAVNKLKSLVQDSRVKIIDWVPELIPYLRSATVYVCPLRTKLKLLEAMALGKASVSTSIGTEGLNVSHGEHLLIADDAQSFANCVCRLLAEIDLRARLGQAARKLVVEEYSWKRIAYKLHDVYLSMIKSHPVKEPVDQP